MSNCECDLKFRFLCNIYKANLLYIYLLAHTRARAHPPHTHTHIYIYIYIYTRTHTHTHTYIYIYTHTHTHIYIYIYINLKLKAFLICNISVLNIRKCKAVSQYISSIKKDNDKTIKSRLRVSHCWSSGELVFNISFSISYIYIYI